MKTARFFATATIVVSALVGNLLLRAEAVEHHGFNVNSAGRYSECLACHDGVIAQSITPCVGTICIFRDSHPINQIYPPPSKQRDFAPASAAESAGIKFVDGQIDCISCHNLENPAQYHLRIEQSQSRLCRSCHLR